MGFTKLNSGITDSSIWDEHSDVMKVFVTFWTKSNSAGEVSGTTKSIFRSSNLLDINKKQQSYAYFEKVLNVLMSPDKTSKSKKCEGRRIVLLEESKWLIVNYKQYRELTYSNNPDSVRKREYRSRTGGTPWDMSQNVQGHSASASLSASSSASGKGSAEGKQKIGIIDPVWIGTTDEAFNEYLNLLDPEWMKLKNDWQWIELMKTRLPNTNIRESLNASYSDFWGTRSGWENKKDAYRKAKRKAVKEKREDFSYVINWKLTMQKVLKLSRVPITFGAADPEQQHIKASKDKAIPSEVIERVPKEEQMTPEDVREVFKMQKDLGDSFTLPPEEREK